MKKYFMNLPLKFKITILNFFIIFLATLFLTSNFYNIYRENVINEIGNYQVRNAEFIRNNIELIESNIESLSTNLLLDQNFQNLLRLSPAQVEDLSQTSQNVNPSHNLALNTLVSNDYISYISIYTQNGFSFYYSKYDRKSALSNIKGSADYADMEALRGSPYWTTYSEDSGYFISDNSGPKLTMLRDILDLNSYTAKGFMVICIDWSTIWSYVPYTGNTAYILTNTKGNILSFDSDYEPIKKASEKQGLSLAAFYNLPDKSIVKLGGAEYLYANSNLATHNFYVLSMMPMSLVMQDANSKAPALLFFLLICLIFSLLASFFTSSLVTKPVKKLIDVIRTVKKGNFVNKVNFLYQDEIGTLGAEYNKMIDELNLLFNKVLQLEIRNRESEIRAMQAQINPHFLYNTLDSIYLKALNANNETADMIYSLSRILRLTLNRGGELTSVQNEKDFIESYLSLQKIRFKDRLDYDIDFDPKMLNVQIPKLILQPFVENAIVHGLDNLDRHLHIRIEGKFSDGALEFLIQDNGCGIEPQLLDNILNGKEKMQSRNSHGFAIRNVKERLRLYYGGSEKHLFHITSVLDVGTIVRISIPEKRLDDVSTISS